MERTPLASSSISTPNTRKIDHSNTKKTSRTNKERKYLQPSKVSLPSPPIEVRGSPRKKFNMKNIRNQYKFSKSEEKLDKPSCHKTEPNTPRKSAGEGQGAGDDLDLPLDMRALSMECLMTDGVSKSFRTRRLKSSHSKSVDRLWLPGKSTKSTSFNSFCSRKFARNEEYRERSLGNYYYTRVISSSTCRHGRKSK